MAHPDTVLTAARLSGVPILIRIAAGVSSPLARRDRRGVLILRSAGLIQFRSAAVGAASLIAGALRAIGARVQRVFAELKMIDRRSLHDGSTIALECLPCPTTDMSKSTREVLPAS